MSTRRTGRDPRALAGALMGACLAAFALTGGVGAAFGQAYPEKPIHLIVAFPPGGINDITARLIGQKIGATLGQPVVIDTRVGASGTIGADIAAKSAPDGYTILLGSVSNIAMAPGQHPRLAYDPARDFAPVALVAAAPNVLVVNPSFPVRSVKDLIALARQKPGMINYASGGSGSSDHVAGELFKFLANVNLVHIPYKGTAPALPVALPFIKDGQLRAVAVSSETRSPQLPDVPTVAESGDLPTFAVSVWVSILAPAGTPKAIVDRLAAAIEEALRDPETRDKLRTLGVEPDYRGPDKFGEYLRAEIAKWNSVGQKTK